MGEDFTIPNALLWDARISKAIEDQDLGQVFELMLGPTGSPACSRSANAPRSAASAFGHLERLMEAVAEAQGIGGLGESRAGERTAREHWRTLEPDFQRFYGLDLAACLAPGEARISTRRLARLIEGVARWRLPPSRPPCPTRNAPGPAGATATNSPSSPST